MAFLAAAACVPADPHRLLQDRIERLEAIAVLDQALDDEFELVLKRVLNDPADRPDLSAILDELELIADYRLEGPRVIRNSGGSTGWWTPWRLLQLLPPQGIERTRWEGDI